MRRIIPFTFFLLFSFPTFADLLLDRMIFDFESNDKKKEDLWVSNNGEETLYVDIAIDEILNPGDYPLKRKEIKNPTEGGLVITPRRLVLPPGKKKLVRYIRTRNLTKDEKIYRVQVVPKLGDVKLQGSADSTKAKNLGIKVMVGYETLVIFRPIKMDLNFEFNRKGKALSAVNKGNTNVLIVMLEQCDETKKTKEKEYCTRISGDRLYPGKKLDFTLPYPTKPVKVYHKIGDETAMKVY